MFEELGKGKQEEEAPTRCTKNVYFNISAVFSVISRGGPRYGTDGSEAFLSFFCFDCDIFPLLTTAGSCFTARSNFTPDLAHAGTGGEDYF
jgi:hypothetical protein